MPQLVGLGCIHCQQRIGDEWEGKFCEECDSPVHVRCVEKINIAEAGNVCIACGAPAAVVQQSALKQRTDVERHQKLIKQQNAYKILGIALLVVLWGAIRLLIHLSRGKDAGELIDALAILMVGVVLLGFGVFQVFRNLSNSTSESEHLVCRTQNSPPPPGTPGRNND